MTQKIQSEFALLDVKRGRKTLEKRLNKGQSVKVLIEAEITRPWGDDDGISKEFVCSVSRVTEV